MTVVTPIHGCEPWCRYGDHAEVVDATCYSEGGKVPLRRYPSIEDPDGNYMASELLVYAHRRAAGVLVVHLARDEEDTLRLTASEARTIGRFLIEQAAVDSWAECETVVDEENGLSVRDTDTGSVYLAGDGWDFSFAPDEARALAFALLVHAAHADREWGQR